MLTKTIKKKDIFLTLLLIEAIAISLLAFMTINRENGFITTLFVKQKAVAQEILKHTPVSGVPGDKPVSTAGEETVQRQITINFTGDIMLASRVGEVIREKGVDYPWAQVQDTLASADITVGNLECAVGGGNYTPVPDKKFTFLAVPESIAGARRAGIDVLTLANNHVLDFGPEALLETILVLKNNDILYTGAGGNAQEALEPVILERNGLKVGIVAFSLVVPWLQWVAGPNTPGINSGYHYEQVYNSVRELDKETDLVIVSLHWGTELADKPTLQQQELARKLIDLGADVVVGHHPHVLQGLEIYKQGLIAYSLGNFIFTLSGDYRGRQSMILQVDAGDRGIYGARVYPAQIEYGRTVPAGEKDRLAIIKRLQNLSLEFNTNINDEGEILF